MLVAATSTGGYPLSLGPLVPLNWLGGEMLQSDASRLADQ